jgi:hypothetical protein
MKSPSHILAAAAVALASTATHAAVFTGVGSDSSSLSSTIADFRTAIGGANNGANNALGTTLTTGRREINWDAGALPGSPMPSDFFNRSTDFNGLAGSRRGAVFSTPGAGFLVSLNSPTDPARGFGDINSAYAAQFAVNSANRLFAPNGSTITDTAFALPNTPGTAAGVTAFGVVFSDVDLADVSGIELYDQADTLLARAFAPLNGGGLSFVGITLDPGQQAARVRVISGNLALGAAALDTVSQDVVAMDDFIYSEPTAFTAVPEPGEYAAFGAVGMAGFALWRRRRTTAKA